MKRLLPLLLSLCLLVLLSACGLSDVVPDAPAEGEKTNDLFRYYYYSDHVEILQYLGTDLEVTVPETLDGVPVTVIGSAAFSGGDVTGVALPDCVTDIADNAFNGCNFMEHFRLPASLKTVGASAFSECCMIKELTFPAGFTTLSEYAFSQCLALEKVTFECPIIVIPSNCFSYCSLLTDVTYSAGTPAEIAEDAFLDCPVADSSPVLSSFTDLPSLDTADVYY